MNRNTIRRLIGIFLLGCGILGLMDVIHWVADVNKDLETLKKIQNSHADAISGISEAAAYRFTVNERVILQMWKNQEQHLKDHGVIL